MKVSIIQPCFIPWLGYFEQIEIGDLFIYMDDVQYTKKDWRNVNQLKSPNGIKKISVPVHKTHRDTLINEVLISYNSDWEDKMMNQIFQWYKKAPYFDEVVNLIEPIIYSKFDKLVELNFALNKAIMDYIGINTPIKFTSDVPRNTDNKNDRIIEICKFYNTTILYDGKSAENFIDKELFKKNNIEVIFQNYQHTSYPQLWGEFEPYMSTVDALMNLGKDSKQVIMSSPIPEKVK